MESETSYKTNTSGEPFERGADIAFVLRAQPTTAKIHTATGTPVPMPALWFHTGVFVRMQGMLYIIRMHLDEGGHVEVRLLEEDVLMIGQIGKVQSVHRIIPGQ